MVNPCDNGDIEFRFFRPSARQVFLVGDFNDWNAGADPMKPTDTGDWIVRVKLPEGAFQFRYLADGEWYLDYLAFGLEVSSSGYNSVVLVEDVERSPAAVG